MHYLRDAPRGEATSRGRFAEAVPPGVRTAAAAPAARGGGLLEEGGELHRGILRGRGHLRPRRELPGAHRHDPATGRGRPLQLPFAPDPPGGHGWPGRRDLRRRAPRRRPGRCEPPGRRGDLRARLPPGPRGEPRPDRAGVRPRQDVHLGAAPPHGRPDAPSRRRLAPRPGAARPARAGLDRGGVRRAHRAGVLRRGPGPAHARDRPDGGGGLVHLRGREDRADRHASDPRAAQPPGGGVGRGRGPCRERDPPVPAVDAARSRADGDLPPRAPSAVPDRSGPGHRRVPGRGGPGGARGGRRHQDVARCRPGPALRLDAGHGAAPRLGGAIGGDASHAADHPRIALSRWTLDGTPVLAWLEEVAGGTALRTADGARIRIAVYNR